MKGKELDKTFREAVDRINEYDQMLPADFLLRLYAYYKRATRSTDPPGSKRSIINAFKANALFQVQDISESEAKRKYIELVNSYFDSLDSQP
ncbi:acyl-CoA-binding protein [Robertkochia aurantiaca]|uniref:acyl-CoA-binding protein n=1 Tax=Robertkochia aurantiaca TaxID=2873700 RepID=UPI001CCD4EA6|nr:acyl-CoA-binding protein [Robertkochia sp. 3YJGBD-33]